jgi:hypothetical protein
MAFGTAASDEKSKARPFSKGASFRETKANALLSSNNFLVGAGSEPLPYTNWAKFYRGMKLLSLPMFHDSTCFAKISPHA